MTVLCRIQRRRRDSESCDSAVTQQCNFLGLLLQGVEPAIRESVWPFLLQLYPAGSSAAERQRLHSELDDAYSSLLNHAQVVKLFTCHFGNSSKKYRVRA